MTIAVLGAGAFGTALAIALSKDGRPVTLWARNAEHAQAICQNRENTLRLPGCALPPSLSITARTEDVQDDVVLLAVPTQKLPDLLNHFDTRLANRTLVACCKGIDLKSLEGPHESLVRARPESGHAILTGPSFADDIARGLPTALTLACKDEALAERLQDHLATATLRFYRTDDVIGAEFGGALKNVIAIACGACIGAGYGESARAALMTRGFAEMTRLAVALGADAGTLSGLSGLGDLALTCGSDMSRNFRYGQALANGQISTDGMTVEGATTAAAALKVARACGVDMPITAVVSNMVSGSMSSQDALRALLARPQGEE